MKLNKANIFKRMHAVCKREHEYFSVGPGPGAFQYMRRLFLCYYGSIIGIYRIRNHNQIVVEEKFLKMHQGMKTTF